MGLVGVLPSREVITAPLDAPLAVPEPDEPEPEPPEEAPELAPESPPEYAFFPAESLEHPGEIMANDSAASADHLPAERAMGAKDAEQESETVIAGWRLYSVA
jgi:hypothetical protein